MLVGDEETFMHGQLGKDMNFELLCIISSCFCLFLRWIVLWQVLEQSNCDCGWDYDS